MMNVQQGQHTIPAVGMLNTAAIPDELRRLPQWVVWKTTPRPGQAKPAKVPYNPFSGTVASPTDPKTWAGFEDALAARATGGYDGVGFVFSDADPYCGIDLDGCRDAATGQLARWARSLINRFGSYAEVSPSGTGLHIWVQARLPGGAGRKGGGVEVYDRARFFAVTGDCWCASSDRCRPVPERQREVLLLLRERGWTAPPPALAPPATPSPASAVGSPPRDGVALDDDALLAKARTAKNGERFRRLYDDGDTGGFRSDSEADLAMTNMLAFWSDDDEQVSRLFLQSALGQRPKADRPDYVLRTIAKARQNPTGVYTPKGGHPQVSKMHAIGTEVAAARVAQLEAEKRCLSGIALVRGNKGLRQARLTAANLAQLLCTHERLTDRDPDGWVRAARGELARLAGCSKDAISNHIDLLVGAGLLDKDVPRIDGRRAADGTWIPPRSELYVRPTAGSALGFIEAAATAKAPPGKAGKGWGGTRTPRCPDHPHAAVVRSSAFACQECGQMLGREVAVVVAGDAGSAAPEDAHTGEDKQDAASPPGVDALVWGGNLPSSSNNHRGYMGRQDAIPPPVDKPTTSHRCGTPPPGTAHQHAATAPEVPAGRVMAVDGSAGDDRWTA